MWPWTPPGEYYFFSIFQPPSTNCTKWKNREEVYNNVNFSVFRRCFTRYPCRDTVNSLLGGVIKWLWEGPWSISHGIKKIRPLLHMLDIIRYVDLKMMWFYTWYVPLSGATRSSTPFSRTFFIISTTKLKKKSNLPLTWSLILDGESKWDK